MKTYSKKLHSNQFTWSDNGKTPIARKTIKTGYSGG